MPHPKPLDPAASPKDWFGAEVRAWREQRGLSQRELGELVHVSAHLIGKIETADRNCSTELASALDAVLNTGGLFSRALLHVQASDNREKEPDSRVEGPSEDDQEPSHGLMLGELASAPTDGSRQSVNRRSFLNRVAAAPLAVHDLLDPIHVIGRRTVRQLDIDQVRQAASTLSDWDNHYGGGGFVGYTASALLQGAASLLDLPCPESLRTELFTSVGQLGMAVGLSAFDAYRFDDSRTALDLVVAVSEEANDWRLRGKALDLQARREIWRGNPDKGLTYAELGLVRSDRLTPTVQATLHTARARAFAKMEQVQETLSAVGTADDAFAHAQPGEEPAFMAYYDAAQHHGDTGHALYDLALLGHDPARAGGRLQTAVNGHTEPYIRSRAISRTKQASLMLAKDDPHEAVAIANAALDEVGSIHSRRAADDMRDLYRLAGPHSALTEVQALRARIADTVLV